MCLVFSACHAWPIYSDSLELKDKFIIQLLIIRFSRKNMTEKHKIELLNTEKITFTKPNAKKYVQLRLAVIWGDVDKCIPEIPNDGLLVCWIPNKLWLSTRKPCYIVYENIHSFCITTCTYQTQFPGRHWNHWNLWKQWNTNTGDSFSNELLVCVWTLELVPGLVMTWIRLLRMARMGILDNSN